MTLVLKLFKFGANVASRIKKGLRKLQLKKYAIADRICLLFIVVKMKHNTKLNLIICVNVCVRCYSPFLTSPLPELDWGRLLICSLFQGFATIDIHLLKLKLT